MHVIADKNNHALHVLNTNWDLIGMQIIKNLDIFFHTAYVLTMKHFICTVFVSGKHNKTSDKCKNVKYIEYIKIINYEPYLVEI